MLQAAQNLEFERAAQLRDKINELNGAPTISSGTSFDGSDPADEGPKDLAAKGERAVGNKRKVAKVIIAFTGSRSIV